MSLRAAAFLLLVCACGDDDGAGGIPDAPPEPDAMGADGAGCSGGYILFLNQAGGTYTPGADDPATNTSSIVTEPRTVPGYPHPGDWAAIVACVREGLSPFDIDVVESDPGDVDHAELVMTDRWWDSGGDSVFSVSPATCAAPARSISFVFGQQLDGMPNVSCQLTLTAFALGATTLDFAVQANDYMSQGTSDAKSWIDADLECGEFSARQCRCGGSTQNSYRTMLATFGACP